MFKKMVCVIVLGVLGGCANEEALSREALLEGMEGKYVSLREAAGLPREELRSSEYCRLGWGFCRRIFASLSRKELEDFEAGGDSGLRKIIKNPEILKKECFGRSGDGFWGDIKRCLSLERWENKQNALREKGSVAAGALLKRWDEIKRVSSLEKNYWWQVAVAPLPPPWPPKSHAQWPEL